MTQRRADKVLDAIGNGGLHAIEEEEAAEAALRERFGADDGSHNFWNQ